MLVSINGEIIHKDDSHIPAFHSGVYYGTGCFETIRAESGKLLFFNEHYRRLKTGLSYLGLDVSSIPNQQAVHDGTVQLLQQNRLIDEVSKVRIQCILAEKNGYSLDDEAEIYTLISAEKYHQRSEARVLTLAKTRVVPDRCLPSNLKLCNMLHYRNAYREAQKKNADDAVMLTVSKRVSETSISNLFWKSGDTLYTPSKNCDLLPGIARKYVIQSIESSPNYNFLKGEYDVDNLMNADSVWVTNSLMEFQPVERIDSHTFEIDRKTTNIILSLYQVMKSDSVM